MTLDVLFMRQVKDLSTYQGEMVGSAINAGVWLPQAMQFVLPHQS